MKPKNYSFVILPLFCCLIFLFSCGSDDIGTTFHEVTLNPDVKTRFRPGTTTEQPLFRITGGNNRDLDIVLPNDPNGRTSIMRSHNYFVSSLTRVTLNWETIATVSLYEIDGDLEDQGELILDNQFISTCTLGHPETGTHPQDVNGEDFVIDIDEDDENNIRNQFTVYLKQCETTNTPRPYGTLGGELTEDCVLDVLDGHLDPMFDSSAVTNDAYPLCMLGASVTITKPTTFYQEVRVRNYNDVVPNFETKTFTTKMTPTFIAVGTLPEPYRMEMTPNPQNSAGNHLYYSFTMPIIDEIWQDNFASDIFIDYVRFYYTSNGIKIPLKRTSANRSLDHEIQINSGSDCDMSDRDGKFNYKVCPILRDYTPAANKLDLSNPITWNLSLPWNGNDQLMSRYWNNPIVIEFGLKAQPNL